MVEGREKKGKNRQKGGTKERLLLRLLKSSATGAIQQDEPKKIKETMGDIAEF